MSTRPCLFSTTTLRLVVLHSISSNSSQSPSHLVNCAVMRLSPMMTGCAGLTPWPERFLGLSG
jgi:hypothetical protein